MLHLKHLLDSNEEWSQTILKSDPQFFERLAKQQSPKYLWIGCSDSRVPANQIVGLAPGELFVHRNVANVVVHSDLNCLSVMQFAVDVLEVKHIIVCGHYGCGGVKAALNESELGLIDNWLAHIKDIKYKHREELAAIQDSDNRCDRLCELNVIEQVANVCRTSIVRDAWKRKLDLTVHGWVYGLQDGILRDLSMCVTNSDEVDQRCASTIAASTGGMA